MIYVYCFLRKFHQFSFIFCILIICHVYFRAWILRISGADAVIAEEQDDIFPSQDHARNLHTAYSSDYNSNASSIVSEMGTEENENCE